MAIPPSLASVGLMLEPPPLLVGEAKSEHERSNEPCLIYVRIISGCDTVHRLPTGNREEVRPERTINGKRKAHGWNIISGVGDEAEVRKDNLEFARVKAIHLRMPPGCELTLPNRVRPGKRDAKTHREVVTGATRVQRRRTASLVFSNQERMRSSQGARVAFGRGKPFP
jgi:hypothetical protein